MRSGNTRRGQVKQQSSQVIDKFVLSDVSILGWSEDNDLLNMIKKI